MSYNSARKQRPDLKILGAFGSKCGVDGDMAIEMARRLTCPSSLPTAELVPLSWT